MWHPERWLLSEITKLAFLITAVVGLFGGASNFTVNIVWFVYDCAVLLQTICLFLVRRSFYLVDDDNNIIELRMSRGTMWYCGLYTLSVGVGWPMMWKLNLYSNAATIGIICTHSVFLIATFFTTAPIFLYILLVLLFVQQAETGKNVEKHIERITLFDSDSSKCYVLSLVL